ncbi:MAG TPA: hypothetical protein VM597_32225 [Gemmataceae bacterium]|nr:hypothetical protein [Gemmataceae bacterium]
MRTDDERHDYDDHPERRRSRSALPLALVLSLVAVGALAVIGCLGFLLTGWGGRPAVPPAAVAVPGPGAGTGAMAIVEGGPKWVKAENDEFQFRAAFPHAEPEPFNPFLDFDKPQGQGAEFLLKTVRGKYLQTTAGGRRYALVATPLDLGALPARQYLRANAGNMGRIHQGWTSEPGPEGESTGHAHQDFTLRKDGRVKLMRWVVVPGFSYSLTVDQVGDVTLSDAMAKKFFDGFASTVPAPAKK